MKQGLRAPGPSLVISLIALFVALSGTSIAAVAFINGSRIKPHSIAANRLTGAAVKQLKGDRGPAGAPGTAVAYAHVLIDGTLDSTRSKHVTAASIATTGIYCLTVSVPVSNASATVESGTDGGGIGYASVVIAAQDPYNEISSTCPAGSNAEVIVANSNQGVVSRAFWVTFN